MSTTENPSRVWRISKSSASLLVALIVASCVQPSPPTRVSPDQELIGRVAGAPRSCITNLSDSNLTAIDSSAFVYRSGDTIYVNHPSSPCPGIAPLNTLIVDAQQGHYCRGDRVRGLEPGAIIAGPVCILGDWVPYRKP